MDTADKQMIDLCKKVPEHLSFAIEEYGEEEKQRIPAGIVFYHSARQFIPELIAERDNLRAQLAASQAREAVLAGALEEIKKYSNPLACGNPIIAMIELAAKADTALTTTPAQTADRWRKMEAVVEAAKEQRKMSHKPMSGHYHAYLKAGMKLDTALAELDALEKEATPVETTP